MAPERRNQIMEKQIGKVNFTKGHVTITDPGYDKYIGCKADINNVFKGEWEASVEVKNCGSYWGNRVTRLILRVPGQKIVKLTKLPDDIGVDSATCGVFEDKPDYSGGGWPVVCDEIDIEHNDYGLASTSNAFRCNGVWSVSGYGDGGYTAVVGTNENAEVVQIVVEYLTDEEVKEEKNMKAINEPISVTRRNSLTLVLNTDDDFWFRNHRSQDCEDERRADPDFVLDWYEVAEYREHRAADLMPVYTFAFEFEDEHVDSVIHFLNQLIEDVRFESHGWVVDELHRMIDPAIAFLKSGRRALFRSSMVNGNWQPSSLVIVREDCKCLPADPNTGEEKYEMLEGVFELDTPVSTEMVK